MAEIREIIKPKERMKKFILEGEWSGYTNRTVCHRTITTNPEKYKDLTFIRFTDGTTLDLSLRPCKPRERVVIINGYNSLIEECIQDGVNAVDDLRKYAKD